MNVADDVALLQEKFRKRGNSGNKGRKFQGHLTTLCLLNAYKALRNWKLSSENEKAGKFDDVVLEWPGGAFLIQAKHREKKTISFHDLLSNNNSCDLCLPKYYLSYREIRDHFQVTNVVICTNARVTVDTSSQNYLNREVVGSDNLLYCQGYDSSFYTLNETILPLLKERLRTYLQLKGDDADKDIISDENIKDFFQHFQFYYNYPSETDLMLVIRELLCHMRLASNDIFCSISPQDILNKVIDWCDLPRGQYEYLSEPQMVAMVSEIRSSKYCETLDLYNVMFENNDFVFKEPKRIFHVVAEDGYFWQVLKIFRVFQTSKIEALYISPDHDNMRGQMVKTFALPRYEFLIIVWPNALQGAAAREIYEKLRVILQTYKYKKIILVTETDNNLAVPFEIPNDIYEVVQGGITFDDFSKETQRYLIKKKIIVFGENNVSLEDIFKRETSRCGAINPAILEKIVKDEKIVVRPHTYIENVYDVNESITTLSMAEGNVNGFLVDKYKDPVNVNVASQPGNAVLGLAADSSDMSIVKLFLEHGTLALRTWKRT